MRYDKHILKLAIGVLTAALVLAARFIFIDATMAKLLVIKCGYWSIAGIFFTFVVLLLINHRQALAALCRQWRAHILGLTCIILSGAYLQLHEPHEFKVLFDEYVISGVARNMHFDREATFPARAHYFNGRLIVMGSGIDKRPFFFQFLISLVHDVTGYRPENVFYLNAAISFLLLSLVYAIGFNLGGLRLGCFGILLLIGLPLIAQNATDGGYELINLSMILLLYFFGSHYYRTQGSQGLNLFILVAVLLAQIRYESILYVLVVPAVVLSKWYYEKRITMTWLAAASPALLLMPLMSNEIFMSTAGFFQTNPGQHFFSLQYLSDNAGRAVYYLFNPSFDGTNSILLSSVGIVALVFFVMLCIGKAKEFFVGRKTEVVLIFILCITLANTLLALCNFWGQWDDPMVSRFSLPLQLLLVVLVLRIIAEFLKARPLPRWMVIVPGIWALLFAVPASARHFATGDIVTDREYAWLIKYLSHKDPSETLTIAGSSLGPILYNMPAISIEEAKARKWQVKACTDGEFYKEVIILQRFMMDYKTGKFAETGPSQLGSGFKLQTLAEKRFRPDIISRISRVVDVDLTGIKPLPAADTEGEFPFKNESELVGRLLRKLP